MNRLLHSGAKPHEDVDMRLIIDSLIAMMLVMLLGGVVWAHRAGRAMDRTQERVFDSLALLHEQAVYHGALGDTELSETGFPKQIAPAWFGTALPFNQFADARRPWIDVAPPGDLGDHPPDPVLTGSREQAGFWYNPARGVFRARVPAMATDAQTLALYNDVNNSALSAVPLRVDESRRPIAHAPLPATATAAAARVVESPKTEAPSQPRVRRPLSVD